MTLFALWQRGLRGPEFTVLHQNGERPLLSSYEIAHKLGAPVKIAPKHEGLSIEDLRRLYSLERALTPAADKWKE